MPSVGRPHLGLLVVSSSSRFHWDLGGGSQLESTRLSTGIHTACIVAVDHNMSSRAACGGGRQSHAGGNSGGTAENRGHVGSDQSAWMGCTSACDQLAPRINR